MKLRGLGPILSLSRRSVVGWGVALLLVQSLVLAFLVAGAYGVVKQYGPGAVSFVSFYAAGQLSAGGHPALAYDKTYHYLAEEALTQPGIQSIPFLYPPVYLLLFTPLALLPPLLAFAIFEAATVLFYLLVLSRILGEWGSAWLVPALAFPATFWTLGYGQNAFLTAALLGAGTLLVDRRPAAAGALFGALCYKPHFALLVPVALLADRRWSAIAAAAATAIVLIGVSLTLFGEETWRAYLQGFFGSQTTYEFELGHANQFALISPFAAARLLGLSAGHARIVQLAATAAAACLVGFVWRAGAAQAIRGAALAAGAVMATPYGLLYDLTIAAIAGAWMVRAGRESGFLPLEKEALAIVYVLPLFALQAGMAFHFPFAPFAGAILVAACARRAWRERRRGRVLSGPSLSGVTLT